MAEAERNGSRTRTAVVTGAGRGIGAVIARRLAADGFHLVLTGRSVEALSAVQTALTAQGARVETVPCDVSSEADVAALRDRSLEMFGGTLDLLVCNSGVGGPITPLTEVTLEEWEHTFAVNVRGVFLSCRAFLPAMLERRGGSVVIIGSMTGKRPLLHRTPYAASKTALIGLVRTLAHEVGPHGVRVNIVSPGAVEGERIERVISKQADAQGITEAEAREQFTAPSALKRMVPAEDVADAVAFLASEAAASITGEDLNVSAGTAMH